MCYSNWVGRSLTVLAVAALSCTPLPLEYQQAAITLTRDGGCDGCPWYALSIYTDGTVVFKGVADVRVRGEHVIKISEDSIQSLVQFMQKSGYFQMKDTSVGRSFFGGETITTSLTVNRKKKQVVDRSDAPKALHLIESRIDQVAGTTRWIANRPPEQSRRMLRLVALRQQVDSLEEIDDDMLDRYESLRSSGNPRSAYHLFYEERKLSAKIDSVYQQFNQQ